MATAWFLRKSENFGRIGRLRRVASAGVGLSLALVGLPAAVIGLTPIPAAAASAYTISGLGGSSSVATAINDSGEVVGWTNGELDDIRGMATSSSVAFAWTPTGGMTDLGTLPGNTNSGAYDVTAGGDVLGYSGQGIFSWTPAGGMVDLGTLPSGYAPVAMNGSGRVVVAPGVFSWTPAGGLVEITGSGGDGYGVNDNGEVVGFVDGIGGYQAFSWTPAAGIVELGYLPANPGTEQFSWANAVSDNGEVVGGSGPGPNEHLFTGFNPPCQCTAFAWTTAGGMVSLGTLPGESYSDALGVNNLGEVVGAAFNDGGADMEAFSWTPAGGMVGLPGGVFANAVNDFGQIVGYGTANGVSGAVIWNPVAATTTTLASTAYVAATNQPVIYTATVTPTPDGGTVNFADNGTPIPSCGAVALFSGTASCPESYSTPGTHTVTAVYSGDPSHTGSISEPFPVSVVAPPPSSLRWGYCVGLNTDIAFQLGVSSYNLLCLVENQGTGSVELMVYGSGSQTLPQPQNATQFAEDVDSVASSCLADVSLSADAVAFEAPTSTDAGAETYATAEAQTGVGIGDIFGGLVSFSVAGAEATMFQSLDQESWGLMYGGSVGAGIACPDPLPVSFTVGTQNDQTFASLVLQGSATTAGTAAYQAAQVLTSLQSSFQTACLLGIAALQGSSLTACGLGAVQLLGPDAVTFVEQSFPAIYLTLYGGQSAPPCPSESCSQSPVSTTNSGLASAGIKGLTAAATGIGAVTVAQYPSDPVSQPSPLSGGEYFDVASASGSLFSSVTIVDCNLAGSNTLYWWDGSSWETVAPQSYSAETGCITATVNVSSSPSSIQLVGTVFGGGFVPSQACITGSTAGPLTIGSGQATCLEGDRVTGPVTVEPGGELWVAGGSITGPLRSTNAAALRVCKVTITGPIRIEGTTGAVVIGDASAACAGNAIEGPVTITNNTGGVVLSGDTITGPVSVTNNSGPAPVVEANHIIGTLACSTNSPAPTNGGDPNSVLGPRSGQCSTL